MSRRSQIKADAILAAGSLFGKRGSGVIRLVAAGETNPECGQSYVSTRRGRQIPREVLSHD